MLQLILLYNALPFTANGYKTGVNTNFQHNCRNWFNDENAIIDISIIMNSGTTYNCD